MEHLGELLSLIGIGLITVAAVFTYARSGTVPNQLVFPAFIAGWILRAVLHPGSDTVAGSMKDAGLAFAVGFGVMLVFWILSFMGAGSVKLTGALSVWLGYKMTVAVTAISVVASILACVAIVFAQSRLEPKPPADDRAVDADTEPKENAEANRSHLSLPFPYLLAAVTWGVVIWYRFVA